MIQTNNITFLTPEDIKKMRESRNQREEEESVKAVKLVAMAVEDYIHEVENK